MVDWVSPNQKDLKDPNEDDKLAKEFQMIEKDQANA